MPFITLMQHTSYINFVHFIIINFEIIYNIFLRKCISSPKRYDRIRYDDYDTFGYIKIEAN